MCATTLPGTVCAWNAKTSRLAGSTSAFTQCTSFNPLTALSEGLDTREVLESLAVLVEQRLVDTEVVRVPVDVHDRLLESNRLVAERRQEVLEAERRRSCVEPRGVECLRVAGMSLEPNLGRCLP